MTISIDTTPIQGLLSVMDTHVGSSDTLTYGMLAMVIVAIAVVYIYVKT